MNTPELRARLTEGGLDQALAMLYGAERVAQQKARYGALLDRHEAQFGTKEEVWFCSAPGRSEIAGNHTDHNHGRVLAAAVHLDTLAAVSPNGQGVVRLYSQG